MALRGFLQRDFLAAQHTKGTIHLPWTTRMTMVELSISQKTSAQESERVGNKHLALYFSDAEANPLVWHHDWKDEILTGYSKDQTLNITIHTLDPIMATHRILNSSNEDVAALASKAFHPYNAHHPDNNVVLLFPLEKNLLSYLTFGEGRVLYANEAFLSSKSLFFESLFRRFASPERQDGKKDVTVTEFSHKVVHNMLEYMYTGKVSLSPAVAEFAHLYDVALYYSVRFLDIHVVIEMVKHNWLNQRATELDSLVNDPQVQRELQLVTDIVHSATEAQATLQSEQCEIAQWKSFDNKLRVSTGLVIAALAGVVNTLSLGLLTPVTLGTYLYVLFKYGGINKLLDKSTI
jgi:hypothetical protein